MGPFIGRLFVAGAIVAATIGVSGTAEAANGHGWRQFSARVEAYAAQRRQLATPLHVTANAADLVAAEDALSQAVRAQRPRAKAGDLFGTDAAAFRRRIDSTLKANGYSAAELLDEINAEAPPAPPQVTVNARFDWRFGAFMPPCLLAVLPELPGELQYRFVGRDLLLIDVDAGLVVDVMPRALTVN